MFRRLLLVLAVLVAGLVFTACSGSGGQTTRYPRLKPGCELAVYNGLPPGGWDDIAPIEVGCYIDEADASCLTRLRAEACRLGGNILYNVPKKPLRPVERAKVFRAQVAHSRDAKTAAEDPPAPTDTDAGSGAIVPLPKSGAASGAVTPPPAAPADAGTP